MVRPESVRLSRPAAAPPAPSSERIVQTSFLGSQTRVAVACDAVDGPVHGGAVRSRTHRRR